MAGLENAALLREQAASLATIEARAEEMTVRVDPEQNETRALFGFVDLDGRRVLEIGSGDGRLTWRYADRAAHVTAVEPFAPAVARAGQNVPPDLSRRVVLRRAAFEEFAAENARRHSTSRSSPGPSAAWTKTTWSPPSRRRVA